VVKTEADAVYLRNEFESTCELLLNDTAKIPSFHITRVIEKLRLILQARETTKGFPIDYGLGWARVHPAA